MALITTVGAPNANSYGSLAEADAYFATQLYNTDWTAATDPNQEAAMIMAAKAIDEGFAFGGRPTSSTQLRRLPRYGMYGPDSVYIASDVIPSLVKEAQFEWAKWFLGNDPSEVNDLAGLGVTEVKIGPLQAKLSEFISSGLQFPLVVANKLRWFGSPLWSIIGSSNSFAPVVRV